MTDNCLLVMTKVKMDNVRKVESNKINKTHFPKLHERIQNKYIEMQKKIEKSKSIDMLNTLSDNLIYTERKRYFSTDDVSNGKQDHTVKNGKKIRTETMSIENTRKTSAIYQDIHVNEVVVTEIEENGDQKEKTDSENEENLPEKIFLSDMSPFSKTSIES